MLETVLFENLVASASPRGRHKHSIYLISLGRGQLQEVMLNNLILALQAVDSPRVMVCVLYLHGVLVYSEAVTTYFSKLDQVTTDTNESVHYSYLLRGAR